MSKRTVDDLLAESRPPRLSLVPGGEREPRGTCHANINATDSIYTHLFNGSHDDDMDRLDATAQTTATPIARIE